MSQLRHTCYGMQPIFPVQKYIAVGDAGRTGLLLQGFLSGTSAAASQMCRRYPLPGPSKESLNQWFVPLFNLGHLVNSLPSSLSTVCELGHSSAAVTLCCVISQEVLSYGHAGVSPYGQ